MKVQVVWRRDVGVRSELRPRPAAWFCSGMLHAGLMLGVLSWPGSSEAPASRERAYQLTRVPLTKDGPLLWYQTSRLPNVAPTLKSAPRPTSASPGKLTEPSIVARPEAKPGKQFAWIPDPPKELDRDVVSPNVIVVAQKPPPLPPPRPKPKTFQPPAPKRPAPEAPQLTPPPEIAARGLPSGTQAALTVPAIRPPKPRAFQPPVAERPAPETPQLAPPPDIAARTSPSSSEAATAVSVPAIKPPPPRQFVPPAAARRAPDVNADPEAQQLAPPPEIAARGVPSDSQAALPVPVPAIKPPPPRQFVPPAAARQAQDATADADAAQLAPPPEIAARGLPSGSPEGVGVSVPAIKPPPPRRFVPPAADRRGPDRGTPSDLAPPPQLEGGGQPSSAAMAIVSVNPAISAPVPVLEGSRTANVTIGAGSGNAAGQPGGGKADIVVPGLSIQGSSGNEPGAAAPPASPPTEPARASAPTPTRTPVNLPTSPSVSLPLWPHSRVLPPAVEGQFAGRVAYATSIRAPAALAPGTDWALWFAGREAVRPGAAVLMRPPVPVEAPQANPAKLVGLPAQGARKIYLAGVLTKDGELQALSAPGIPDSAVRDLLDALQGWRFSPAIRNGQPVDVDFLLELTFAGKSH